MTVEPIYYVGLHHYVFRPNQPAEVIGVVSCVPDGTIIKRPCFVVRYPDGLVDYNPIADNGATYKLVTKDELP